MRVMVLKMKPSLVTAFTVLALVTAVGEAQYLETVIDLGRSAQELLWNPVSNKVYTSNSDNTVSIIDGTANTLIATIHVPEYPGALARNPCTNTVYCTNGQANELYAIDGYGDTVRSTLGISNWPSQMAFCATLNKLYVMCDDRVAVVDGRADTLLRYIQPAGGGILLWHPTSNRLFCYTTESVYVVDCLSDTVVGKLYSGDSYRNWTLNTVNDLAYLTGFHGVLAFQASGDTIVARVPGYVGYTGACFVPFANKLYLSTWHLRNQIAVLDCGSHTIDDTLAVNSGRMVCDTTHGRVYVSSTSGTYPTVTVVDASADSVVSTILLAPYLGAICWNWLNSRVYVASETQRLLYVIRDTTAAIAEPQTQRASRRVSSTSLVPVGSEWTSAEAGSLLDACGRRVAEVRQGLNQLRGVPAGVYVAVTSSGRVSARLMVVRR